MVNVVNDGTRDGIAEAVSAIGKASRDTPKFDLGAAWSNSPKEAPGKPCQLQ